MATTSPTRIDDELYAAAKAEGAVMSRSAAQQIAHWARVGRELEAAPSVSHRDIERVLAGEHDYDDLGQREQAAVRAAWSERVAARRAALDFTREFTERGLPYVELDEGGQVVRREPPPASTDR